MDVSIGRCESTLTPTITLIQTLTLTRNPNQEQAEDGFTSIAEYFGRGMFGAPPP